jgi:hypothetical protein
MANESTGQKRYDNQTDQRQLQATAGGANSPVVGGDGTINTGTSLSSSGSIAFSDQGAISSAFNFGTNVIAEVGKVFANEAATQRDTVAANTANLSGIASLVSSNSAGGMTASANKTILYVVGAALAVVGLIFFLRR